jgi:hypothetical protein
MKSREQKKFEKRYQKHLMVLENHGMRLATNPIRRIPDGSGRSSAGDESSGERMRNQEEGEHSHS